MFKAGTTEMGWPVIECNIGENIGKNLSLFTMASVMVNITMIGVIDSTCITLIRHSMFRSLSKPTHYKAGKSN